MHIDLLSEGEDDSPWGKRDSGRGFTEGGLKNATSQFYMEANERKVGEHYGMGLYIAESVAKKHGGFVILKNREDKVGAEVSLMINTKVWYIQIDYTYT